MQRGGDAERERCREGEVQRGKDERYDSVQPLLFRDCCYTLTLHGDCDLDRVKINKHVFGK